MAMQWHNLLFAHWPARPELVRPFLPPGLELQTWQGQAWLGLVPFEMRGVRPRFVPPLPGISAFPELNLRTYVTHGGRPGVWFFSLDAANPLAVRAARLGFHLPYFDAQMRCMLQGETVHYQSVRRHRGMAPAAFRAEYTPTGPVYTSVPGSLEHWLTERYCLYAADRRGRLWRGDIHHDPWPLQPARATITTNHLADRLGLLLDHRPPLLHFTRRIDVVAWLPERVDVGA
jgi:uncharacterized protein YqjF (DUF2071 family)